MQSNGEHIARHCTKYGNIDEAVRGGCEQVNWATQRGREGGREGGREKGREEEGREGGGREGGGREGGREGGRKGGREGGGREGETTNIHPKIHADNIYL